MQDNHLAVSSLFHIQNNSETIHDFPIISKSFAFLFARYAISKEQIWRSIRQTRV